MIFNLFTDKKSQKACDILVSIATAFVGKHEVKGTNRADWLDIIQRRAKMVGQPWCAIIVFWEWIPTVEQITGIKSKLIPSAIVRRAAELNKKLLHKDPKVGDVGFLGTKGSWTGHMVIVTGVGEDAGGKFYTTIEGNTSSSDNTNRNGGEVATHKRYRHGKGFEEIGFATPF